MLDLLAQVAIQQEDREETLYLQETGVVAITVEIKK